MFLGPQYDLIWSAGALVAVALTFAALVVWFRTRWDRASEAALTLLVILLVPVLGPAAFLASRGRRPVPVKVRSSDRQA
jgi:hypothetical protein